MPSRNWSTTGDTVEIESGAGIATGFDDDSYSEAGATDCR